MKAGELLPQLADGQAGAFRGLSREARSSLPWATRCASPATAGTSTGKHRIDNGRIDTIAGFTPGGDIVLSNGWVLGKDFAHLKHGLVQTSPATQSKTDDIVLAAMNQASLGGDVGGARPTSPSRAGGNAA